MSRGEMPVDAAPCAVAGCTRAAAWVILVGGEEARYVACDEHRNDVLFRFDPKTGQATATA